MKRLILFCAICSTVAACSPATEYVYLSPDVPAELLEPTPISDREAETYRDLAVLATEHLNSARQANADKAALRDILQPPCKGDGPCSD